VWTPQAEALAQQIEVTERWGRNLYSLMWSRFTGKQAKLGDPVRFHHPARDHIYAQQEARRPRTVSLGDMVARIER